MEKFGEALGWAAAVCYFAAVANLFIKQIFRAYIAKLPADNLWKRRYQLLMKLIVKYHRYFGIGAGVFALSHLCWQIAYVRLAYTGVLVTALMAVAVLLGVFVFNGKKRSLTGAHRMLSLTVLAVLLLHMFAKL